MEQLLKVSEICWNAVGDRALEMVPDEFVWVEFGSIAWKSVGMEAGMSCKKLADHSPLMGFAVIPEQDHRATQVSKQMAQELGHLRGTDVFVRVETGIESDTSFLWGHSNRREGRDLSPSSGTAKIGSLPLGRPGPSDVGDQKEAALIEESQMGAKSLGFFLSAATGNASSARWPLRSFPALFSRASGSSNPTLSKAAIGDWDGKEPQTAPGSLLPLAAWSKDPWYSRNSMAPSKEFASAPASAARSTEQACRAPAWLSDPARLSCAASRAIKTQNLENSRPSWPPLKALIPSSEVPRLVVGEVLTAFGFHVVA